MADSVNVRCLWCGRIKAVEAEAAQIFTGCARACRRGVVRMLNALWSAKLGSAVEAAILKRLRTRAEVREGQAKARLAWRGKA